MMNWQLIFNPFSKFSERKLLVFGIVLSILGIYIGYICSCSFSGALNLQPLDQISLKRVAIENIINIATVTIVLFALGSYLNPKTRLVDVFLVAMLYRLPLYIDALFSVLLLPKNSNEKIINNMNTPETIFDNQIDMVFMAAFGLVTLLLAAYSVVLLTYGFKTATNTKKWQHFVVFAIMIVVIIGLSKLIIATIY